MYEEQCESSIRLLDRELTVTAVWSAVHGQLLLERATKQTICNTAHCSGLALKLFVHTVGAFSARHIGDLSRSRAYLVQYGLPVQTKNSATHTPKCKCRVFNKSAFLPPFPQGSPSIRPYGVTKKPAIVFSHERADRERRCSILARTGP